MTAAGILPITPGDITLILCVRAHAGNPWVVDRLRLIAEHHKPLPNVLVVDFGSADEYAGRVRGACDASGFIYLYHPDKGTFSLSLARNVGAMAAATDLLFFSDVDFVFRSDFFAELARLATALDITRTIDAVVDLPACHLTERATNEVADLAPVDRSIALDRMAITSLYQEFGGDFEFIAPYSNVFLINRTFFRLIGGYDTGFRGHGSEDFELFCRIGIHSRYFPVPIYLSVNKYQPRLQSFFEYKDYEGFRRLHEAVCLPAELAGLKAYHLWHPTPVDEWRTNNDWKRERLYTALDAYGVDGRFLGGIDFLPHERVALCICRSPDHSDYFLPLRLAGYRLVPLFDHEEETVARGLALVEGGEVDAVAVFNPHMISHRAFMPIFTAAKQRQVKTVVVERGALPNSIYYADDVSYVDESFAGPAFREAVFSDAEIAEARAYVAELRRGAMSLEQLSTYAETATRYGDLPKDGRTIVFAPLQLDDDMAVTKFVKGAEPYDRYVQSIARVTAENPDILFIIKPHPLSKVELPLGAPNVRLADRSDNVHCLIDLASGTVCYNSGVGLLSIFHEKPTATTGNAFYNYAGTGTDTESFADAVARMKAGSIAKPEREAVERLAAWFLCRKYSFFVADDNIQEMAHRKSHGYKNILVTRFRWDGHDFALGRQRERGRFSPRSYGWSRFNLDLAGELPKRRAARRPLRRLARAVMKPFKAR